MILMALAEFYYAVRQRATDALGLLEKAVRIDPNSAEARGRLGEVYLSQNRPVDAERETIAAVRLLPDDARLVGISASSGYTSIARPKRSHSSCDRVT